MLMIYEVKFYVRIFFKHQICPGSIGPEGHQRVAKVKTVQGLKHFQTVSLL